MSATVLALAAFGLFIIVLIAGLPLAFGLGGIAIIGIYCLWGVNGLYMVASRAYGIMEVYTIACVPMFVFMGVMLERSGVAAGLFSMMHKWSGGLRGSLAIGTVVICMIFAAMTGLSAAATITMGLVALPIMLRHKYDKSMALGCIAAGGALGILIPPSVTMVLYAVIAQQSVGKLFAGGILPGMILGFLFITYILVRSRLQPNVAPALPVERRVTWGEKLSSLRAVILPIVIIFMVLGSIFSGAATVTEAAGLGAFGSILSAAVGRKLNWKTIKEACYETVKVTAMAMWIYLGSMSFTTMYFASGARDVVEGVLLSLPGGRWGVMIGIQVIWIILGCLMDPWGILMIAAPIFIPVVTGLGFDLVWFGVVFIVNMEMAYMTPPFGFNLFWLKGVAPPEISMGDIYRSVWPYVGCQLFCLVLVLIFPGLCLWLAGMVGK